MNVVLIDDENLALNYLEHHLQSIFGIHVAGKFINPVEGKEFILRTDIDVVFLDIHLPEISGIELAGQLLQFKPRLNIVFVTAYDDYAVKAFELNALDYVMKPLRKERLTITLERIRERLEGVPAAPPAAKEELHVSLFQQL
ncbi:LytR/AlgR family response regulator transcription factor [Paenibacillus macerans]|nr:response regulator [Paenibacillus macerans]KFN11256.1 response regulator [Paenibacillus macerans]SUD26800.1 chemotaxis response regulator protein-glutamate methylesterase 1 [Paenibacillus macerans]